MSLCVGDVGSIIDLNITELNTAGDEQYTNFIPGTDTVNFVFRFSDGTVLSQAGSFVTGSKARYTTVADDLKDAPGRLEIQLQITSASWTGCSTLFVTNLIKKIA